MGVVIQQHLEGTINWEGFQTGTVQTHPSGAAMKFGTFSKGHGGLHEATLPISLAKLGIFQKFISTIVSCKGIIKDL